MTLYTFDDVVLVPQYSELRSRSEADTGTMFWKYKLRNPIISANMETVTGVEMAIAMWDAGGMGSLHRFWSIEENVEAYLKVSKCYRTIDELRSYKQPDCLVSVGVKPEDKERALALFKAGARMFIIDIAHGHSIMMKEMIQWMRDKLSSDIFIVAGNVATASAVSDLADWGADVIKVGVGGGSVCTTRLVTGHGVPTFSAIQDSIGSSIPIIADGGIRTSGDIVKSFVAGADYVMLGALLAGTDEAPGVQSGPMPHGPFCKVYRGSASYSRKGVAKEGVVKTIPCKGPVKEVISSLVGGLRSGMSYCNAIALHEIHARAQWKLQTANGIIEGRPHIES